MPEQPPLAPLHPPQAPKPFGKELREIIFDTLVADPTFIGLFPASIQGNGRWFHQLNSRAVDVWPSVSFVIRSPNRTGDMDALCLYRPEIQLIFYTLDVDEADTLKANAERVLTIPELRSTLDTTNFRVDHLRCVEAVDTAFPVRQSVEGDRPLLALPSDWESRIKQITP